MARLPFFVQRYYGPTPPCFIVSYLQHDMIVVMIVVNKGDWLLRPDKFKGNKDDKIYVGKHTTVNDLLFCTQRLCMNYGAERFLLSSSSVRSKQPLYLVHGQGQKGEQKHTTKNFVGLHNHSPLLTMDHYDFGGVS